MENLCPELHVEIKKYLDVNDYINYSTTCFLAGYINIPNRDIQLRKCGIFNLSLQQLKDSKYEGCGHIHCMKYIITNTPLEPDEYLNKVYSRFIRRMSLKGDLNSIKYIVENTCITMDDIKGPNMKNNALIFASMKGHMKIIKYFVEELGMTKEDVRASDNEALKLASEYGYLDIVKYFMEKVELEIVDLTRSRTQGTYALRRAHICNQTHITKYMYDLYSKSLECSVN